MGGVCGSTDAAPGTRTALPLSLVTTQASRHVLCLYSPVISCQVVRAFGFNNGHQHGAKPPMQEPVGVYNEDALQRMDFVLAAAGAIGIRMILPMVRRCCQRVC